MKGIILFLELPKNWHLIVFVIVVLIILGLHLYHLVYKKRRSKEVLKENEETTPHKEVPVTDEKPTPKIDGYHPKGSPNCDPNLYISDVDSNLRVRVISHKNLDILTYVTSLPHKLLNVDNLKKEILQIVSVSFNDYAVTITKSSAANFSDFDLQIKDLLFAQLHTVYAGRFFRQRVLTEIKGHNSLILKFLKFKIDDALIAYLNERPAIKGVYSYPNYGQEFESALVVVKEKESSAQDFEADILAALERYFVSGVDFERQLSEDIKRNSGDSWTEDLI